MAMMWSAIVLLSAAVIGLLMMLLRERRQHAAATADLCAVRQARAEGKLDDAGFEQRQQAIEARLRDHPNALKWVGVPMVLALIGVAGYWFSSPASKEPAFVSGMPLNPPKFPLIAKGKPGDAPAMPAMQGNAGDLNVMAKRLADKLAKDPDNGEGWLLLARTYGEIRQPKEAAEAYAKAAKLLTLDATTLADWADAQVMANGRKWNAEAKGTVERALSADPKHLKALALAGSEAFERAEYKTAIAYWQRLRAAAPPDSADAKLAEANIQEAEAMRAGKKPLDRIMDSAPAGK